jgi:universal stress protein E
VNLDNLLVIADRDDSQHRALSVALDLMRHGANRATLAGFVYDPIVEQPDLVSPQAAQRVRDAMIRDKTAWLKGAVRRAAPRTTRIRTQTVWAKDIAAWIAENCGPADFGLIVKAGHRSEKLGHTPTDWRLLREAPAPVLIARGKLRLKPGRILAAVDLGSKKPAQRALDKRVLKAGTLLARQLGGELYVGYAIPMSSVAHDMDLIDRSALERRARERLARTIATLAEEFAIPLANFRLKAGPPERVIDGLASKLKASLVVMGTIGRRGLKGKLLGNTAEKVLHHNRTSVVALRPDQ